MNGCRLKVAGGQVRVTTRDLKARNPEPATFNQ